ncbi:MAG: hypothetical protein D6706_11640 [Chloroflexi bacterium]|nr:MAG: hypothetical protein D6706_11640 [Chloroflexota bacterium]
MTERNQLSQKLEFRRPTLVIGLGGTGHRIVFHLKKLVYQNQQPLSNRQRIKFLVFDTSNEELEDIVHGQKITLEPGSEFIDIGQTPVAKIKYNLDRQSAIKERMGSIMSALPPTVLRNGAKQLRPLGLLAFLWRYKDVEKVLRDAIWELAGREHEYEQDGITVFIVNSLVGGTGSSTFIDVAYIVRQLFERLGSLADFCYIIGVGVLPRAFHGINGPYLVPNAVASLKELNECMMHGNFRVRYPNGNIIHTEYPPFNLYYLLDGIDEQGHTWSGQNEVCQLAAEAIFLQMGSQIGRKSENDFDNLDDVLMQKTEDGIGTFFGSFGLASIVFPGESVARLCAARHAQSVIRNKIIAQPNHETVNVDRVVEQYLDAAGLHASGLSDRLACDEDGIPLNIDLTAPAWVKRLSPASIPTELIRYVRDYEQARLGTDFKRWLLQNQEQIAHRSRELLLEQINLLSRTEGIQTTEIFLARLLERLHRMASQLVLQQAEWDGQQTTLFQELEHLETAFAQAGEVNFLWRTRKVAQAQQVYLSAAQNLFDIRWRNQIAASMLSVLSQVKHTAQEAVEKCRATRGRLQAVLGNLERKTDSTAGPVVLDGFTARSLARSSLIDFLYKKYAPSVADTLTSLFSQHSSPLDWSDSTPQDIETALLELCSLPFEAIAQLSVEDVILMHPDGETPESLYTWLTSQATPSWNLDLTRLPDGGAMLQRLEVIGVPDETSSVYRHRANVLVSTGKRDRITAFVARIGAPFTAIQHWDHYLNVYKRVRGHAPLHILPQFQADNNWARQTFVLGLVFERIISQGSYFYYIPADPLKSREPLGQGLANSLQTFIENEALVQEVRELIEHQVAAEGVQAALRRVTRYYDTPSKNNRMQADDLVLELKRLVRAYADELRQIYQLGPEMGRNAGDIDFDDDKERTRDENDGD